MDTVSPETRSRVMAQVRSQRNRSTEWRLRACLIQAGIRGWKLNPQDIDGKPDFAFPGRRVLLFVDGCYWHGCPRCYRRPSSHTDYWDAKVRRNRARDRRTTARLKRDGWRVLRIWEHQLSATDLILGRIKAALVDAPAFPSGAHN
ncbi:MAG: very short patch repair endonuclease [Bryobacteraceae bacterium]|jgi:DNA mismatch endonuclease (patch repair protein)